MTPRVSEARGAAGGTALTGLQVMQAMVDGTAPSAPMGKHMNMRPVECGLGWFVMEAVPDASHLNPMGTIHGGFAATLLDSAMMLAAFTTLPAGMAATTVDLAVTYVKAIHPHTGPVTVRGESIVTGGRIATAQGKITDAAGRLLAHGTTTCLVFPRG